MECEFDVTFDIADPIGFATNKEGNAQMLVEEHYVGRCYKDVYITELTQILKTSAIRILNQGADGKGYINVRFAAKCHRYAPGDIIPALRVVLSTPMVLGRCEKPAPAVVTLDTANQTIAQHQTVPVVVTKAEYMPMSDKAGVYGTQLVCRKEAKFWRLTDSLNEEGKRLVGEEIEKINELLQERERVRATHADGMDFFEKLLRSTDGAEPEVVPFSELVSMDLAGKVIGKPLEALPSVAGAAIVEEEGRPSTALAALLDLAHETQQYLAALNVLPVEFEEPEKIKSHANLWRYMRMQQN